MKERSCQTCEGGWNDCFLNPSGGCIDYKMRLFWTPAERAGLKALGNEHKIAKGKWHYYMKNKDNIAPSWHTATIVVRWAIRAYVQAAITAKEKP